MKLRSPCLLAGEEMHAWEIKKLASLCEAVFAGRMHACIGALSSGVPAMGLAYQGKFEGLMQHFGLDGLIVPPSAIKKPEDLVGAIEAPWLSRQEVAAKLRRKLPDIRRLALSNLI